MKIINIKNCHVCPFSNNDNEFGKDLCNLAYSIGCDDPDRNGENELPSDKIADGCPLVGGVFITTDKIELV